MIQGTNGKVLNILPPAAIKDDASWTISEIDAAGYSKLDIYFCLGATDIAMAALKLQESNETGTGFADITGADFSVSPAALPSSTQDNGIFAIHVDLQGPRKRFFQLVATAGNGSTGTYASAIAILSRPEQSPASATARGLTAELFV